MDETIDTYNAVALGWNNFRQKPMFSSWLCFLKERWKSGTILDIGCGNARNMAPFSEGFTLIGIDKSEGMIEKAREFSSKHNFKAEFYVADALSLPFDSKSIDNAIAIAVYHHTEPDELKTALKELKRVLKADGEAFITVWNRLQAKFILRGKIQKIPWTRRKDNRVFYRKYCFYTLWELKKIIKYSGFDIVMEGAENSFRRKVFSENICILARKKG